MKPIQLDTSLISSALSPFLSDDACSPIQVRDTLEFCNSLIGADSIAYDGQVRQWTEDRIGKSISSVLEQLQDTNAADSFKSVFSPIVLEGERKTTVPQIAISRATFFLEEICKNVALLTPYIRGRGPTDPETFLYPHLTSKSKPSDDYLAAILQNKSITGRRFYWAMLSHEKTRVRLSNAHLKGILDSNILSILFTAFRVYFAYNRADDDGGDRYLYIPSAERRCLIARIFELIPDLAEELHLPIGYEDLSSRMIRAWDATSNEVASFRRTVYPGFISLAIREFKPTDRESFMRACLLAKELDVVVKLRGLEQQLSSSISSGGSTDEIIAHAVELYTQYSKGKGPKSEARKSLLCSWILAVFAFLPPNLATIATVTDVLKGTLEHFKQWESQQGRTTMLLAKDLMPCILPDKDIALTIKDIFGSIPAG